MKILHLLRSISADQGGPVEGVRQLLAPMRSLGHSISVASLDSERDASKVEFPVEVFALGPSAGTYGYSRRLLPWLKEHSKRYDAVVVNGIWQYHSFAAWRALANGSVPYYVFTHGMLDPWFRRAYPLKHLKKWAYWPWAEYRVLRDARAVIFTCEQERLLARQSFCLYSAKERVTRYGTAGPAHDSLELKKHFFSQHPELSGKDIILFLGRLHEKKGLDLLIRAFSDVCRLHPNLRLVIAGPETGEYAKAMRELTSACNVVDKVAWLGMVGGRDKWAAFSAADVFCLPSHQENFGIVVAEALASATPVLVTDKVNIWREIVGVGAGFSDSDTPAGVQRLLEKWLAMSFSERQAMAQEARKCFEKYFQIEAAAAELSNILQGRAGAGVS